MITFNKHAFAITLLGAGISFGAVIPGAVFADEESRWSLKSYLAFGSANESFSTEVSRLKPIGLRAASYDSYARNLDPADEFVSYSPSTDVGINVSMENQVASVSSTCLIVAARLDLL